MQELIRGYHRNNGGPRCAIKVDFQKAYDSVEWSFVKKVLEAMNFHPTMVDWLCYFSPLLYFS